MEQVNSFGQTITLVHFTYMPTGLDGEDWRIACMPNMVEFHSTNYHPNYQRTSDPRAVTCPACKNSQTFKKAMSNLEDGLRSMARGK